MLVGRNKLDKVLNLTRKKRLRRWRDHLRASQELMKGIGWSNRSGAARAAFRPRGRRSSAGRAVVLNPRHVDHRFGKSLRRLLRQVVPDPAADQAMGISAGELLCI